MSLASPAGIHHEIQYLMHVNNKYIVQLPKTDFRSVDRDFLTSAHENIILMVSSLKGVTRRDRVRNLEIRRELRVEPLLEEIERIQLRWYAHVVRMADNRLPKKYLLWQPSGSRLVGRPRKRWIDGIRVAIEKRGDALSTIEESQKYFDRQKWRGFSWRPTS